MFFCKYERCGVWTFRPIWTFRPKTKWTFRPNFAGRNVQIFFGQKILDVSAKKKIGRNVQFFWPKRPIFFSAKKIGRYLTLFNHPYRFRLKSIPLKSIPHITTYYMFVAETSKIVAETSKEFLAETSNLFLAETSKLAETSTILAETSKEFWPKRPIWPKRPEPI